MNSLVVLVAFVAGLVQAVPSGWAGVPLAHHGAYAHPGLYAHAGYAHVAPVHGAYAHGAPAHGAWHGPINIPVVLPSGHLADTHDVSALKHAHAVAVANTPGAHGAAVHAPVHGAYVHAAPVHGAYAHGTYGHGAWHGPINIPAALRPPRRHP